MSPSVIPAFIAGTIGKVVHWKPPDPQGTHWLKNVLGTGKFYPPVHSAVSYLIVGLIKLGFDASQLLAKVNQGLPRVKFNRSDFDAQKPITVQRVLVSSKNSVELMGSVKRLLLSQTPS